MGLKAVARPQGSENFTSLTVTGTTTLAALVMARKTVAFADTPYAVTATDYQIDVDTSGGAVTVTLPASPTNGRELNIKKITTDANVLTIACNTKNIEGAASDVTTSSGARPNYAIQYDSTAAGWWIQ